MSGLSHTPGKRAWGKTHRGFESRLLRQKKKSPVVHCATGLFPFQGLFPWAVCQVIRARPDRAVFTWL